jgi:osmotically-inducible protein OsmY
MAKLPLERLALSMVVLAISVPACNRQPATETAETGNAAALTEMSDPLLETSVRARLYAAGATRDSDIDVSATSGVVTLSGQVENPIIEQQALAVARETEGVTRVEDQLAVATTGTEAARPDGAANARTAERDVTNITNTPGWITTKIQAQYFLDPDIKPWNIDVTTSSGGVVELRGEVDSADDKAEAVRIARATEGVTRVEDHLRVRGDTATATEAAAAELERLAGSDPWITAKVQAKYFLDPDVKALDLDVTTRDGVVTLQGAVETEAERRHAVAIARNTDGVRDVRDDLRVGVDAPNEPRGTSGRGILAGATDPWITTKIQSKYFLDADVKGHRIDVDTRDGVVTLSGTVASTTRRELAEQIARDTDGVTRVINRLTVAP